MRPRPAPAAPRPAPPRGPGREREPATVQAVQTMARRMDLLTAVTRLLLENSTFSESLTLQRCARLLAGEFASWVIVDVVRGRRLRRQFAVGPSGEEPESVARAARDTDPEPGSLPWQVHQTGKSLLQARSDDTGMLGAGPDGVPLMMKLGATSVLSVPIADRERGYGVITLCRRAGEGLFQIADLALAEELGAQLAVAIRVDRLFRRRSEVAEALQASLLPRVLPDVPGIELAAAYMGATEGLDVGGDFYDVYRIPGGWGLAIGDVTGKGEEAAALTAAARYAIRVIAHWEPDPVEVLTKANDVLLAEQSGGRFVTAKTAHMAWRGDCLHIALGTAGHPGPAVIRSDGRVEMLGGGGLPLGLFPAAQPGLEEVELAKGDLLFFYTDGLTETRSPDLEYFEERLPDELVKLAGRSAAEVVAGVQARAEAFSAGEMRDDLTVLALRVTGPLGASLTRSGRRLLVDVLDHLGVAGHPLLRFRRQVVVPVRAVAGGPLGRHLLVRRLGRLLPPGHLRVRLEARPVRDVGLGVRGARVAQHVRRVGGLLHPADRAPPGPAHVDAPPQPLVSALGRDEPDDADHHDHEAGHMQVEDRCIRGHGKGENGPDGDPEQADAALHGFPFLEKCAGHTRAFMVGRR